MLICSGSRIIVMRALLLVYAIWGDARTSATAFQHHSAISKKSSFLGRPIHLLRAHRSKLSAKGYDPLNLADDFADASQRNPMATGAAGIAASTSLLTLGIGAQQAIAASGISQGSLDPQSFVPVCPASDGFYRFLQGSTQAVVGEESFAEYGPLIAGGLLRVRLELCVVESFINEAVIPFVKQNGLSWILPWHETVETFLAGTIFALATTFILIGSTKIMTIIITYTDFLIGLPFRLLGGFTCDRALGKPVTLDIGLGPFKTRLIGPPVEEDGTGEIDWSKLGVGTLITVAISGGVRLIGQVVGVSAGLLYRSMKLLTDASGCRLFARSWMRWTLSSANTSCFGRLSTSWSSLRITRSFPTFLETLSVLKGVSHLISLPSYPLFFGTLHATGSARASGSMGQYPVVAPWRAIGVRWKPAIFKNVVILSRNPARRIDFLNIIAPSVSLQLPSRMSFLVLDHDDEITRVP